MEEVMLLLLLLLLMMEMEMCQGVGQSEPWGEVL